MRARDHDSISNAFDTLVRVLHATSPGKPKNLDWLASTAARSFVFNDYDRFPRFLSNTQPVHQLLLLSWDPSGFRTSNGGLRGRILDDARYFVYNLSKYSVKSNWGAFCLSGSEDGALMFTANWEHIRYCGHILQLRGKDVESPPYGLCNAIAYSAPDSHSRASDDWAGVEGVWMRDVHYLDYGTLIGTSATCGCPSSDVFSPRPQCACVECHLSWVRYEHYFRLPQTNMEISLPMRVNSLKVLRASR
jgi:hypothetical protein